MKQTLDSAILNFFNNFSLFESYFDGLNSSRLAPCSTKLSIFLLSYVSYDLKMSRVVDVVFLGIFSRNPNRKPLQSSRLPTSSHEASLRNIPSITNVSEMGEVFQANIITNRRRYDWKSLKSSVLAFSTKPLIIISSPITNTLEMDQNFQWDIFNNCLN